MGYYPFGIFKIRPKIRSGRRVEKKKIEVEGSNLQKVTQFANIIRSFKAPEPYKGKGIKFLQEKIVLKESKKSK